jgi:hypothetical protein
VGRVAVVVVGLGSDALRENLRKKGKEERAKSIHSFIVSLLASYPTTFYHSERSN